MADATVLTKVRETQDSGPAIFWLDAADQTAVKPRCRISLGRIANKREVLKRDWWKEDPILRDHLIMRMANHSTFRIEGDQLARLERLWERTGSDWSYEEAVAGLWAFQKTRGGPVSRLPGSAVADVALLVGRPTSGVYNMVMNFRALDPQDERTGLEGISEQGRSVWQQFASNSGLRVSELEAEFQRLWSLGDRPVDVSAARKEYEKQVDHLSHELSLEELWSRYTKVNAGKVKKPPVKRGTTKVFARDPLVGAIARKRANFQCEVPECTVPSFLDGEGVRYVEVHHIQTLANGGADSPENVACLCPVHHREVHHGAQSSDLVSKLFSVRASEPRSTI